MARSTPERVWQALTDPAFTERYWGAALDSDWTPGSTITLGEFVKLTVIHDGFEPGSEVLATVSQGWPHILANLKTLLETGETLPVSQTRVAEVQAAAG